MASSTANFRGLVLAIVLLSASSAAYGQLSTTFYATDCPLLESIVRSVVSSAVASDPRMAASLVRLFFHDCFVQGCDASILLDDVPGVIDSEKNAFPNVNSVRGYEVIDSIKTAVSNANCTTVSCADIVALAARDGTNLMGGPTWDVPLGRRDSTTASRSLANSDLPAPSSSLSTLITAFGNKGLSATDLTALSGAHTFGFAQCQNFRQHIYSDTNINNQFAKLRQASCPATSGSGDSNLAPLDVTTQNDFDNAYFSNLVRRKGLLHSDQELYNGGSQDSLVQVYSGNNTQFFADFAAAMVRMGNISPLTGSAGQIRSNCRVVN